MTNLDRVLKSRDITLLTKVHVVKAMVFSAITYRCESWKTKIMASGPITSWQIDGETVADFIFWGSHSLQMVTAAMKLKDVCSLEEKL